MIGPYMYLSNLSLFDLIWQFPRKIKNLELLSLIQKENRNTCHSHKKQMFTKLILYILTIIVINGLFVWLKNHCEVTIGCKTLKPTYSSKFYRHRRHAVICSSSLTIGFFMIQFKTNISNMNIFMSTQSTNGIQWN